MKQISFVQSALVIFALLGIAGLATSQAEGDTKQDKPDASEPGLKVLERGAEVYTRQCAECHGDRGQGVEGAYEKALGGDRSVQWLTQRIDRTMPEGQADKCVGEDAAAVARYLYDHFYAEDAKSGPADSARRELQHLTVEQHRQSLADLIASFDTQKPIGEARGLKAKYYADGKLRGKPIGERIEVNADLVFTPDHTFAEQFDPKGHSVRLSGSLIAPETGAYEIVIRSDRAVRLWLNDGKAQGGGAGNEFAEVDPALIDGWVKSKDVVEFRQRVTLLGGRAYPLLLDFSARNQGVQRDVNPQQADRPNTYVSLRWVMPGRTEQVIDHRYLTPERHAEVFVATTPFPPNDSSMGFDRGAGVSQAWLDGVTGAAVETADHTVKRFEKLATRTIDFKDKKDPTRLLLYQFVERALRRPLNDTDKANYVDRYLKAASEPTAGLRQVVLATLISPGFLYPDALTDTTGDHAIAARLALAMYNGLPDARLREAAAKGELRDIELLRAHARRLSHDPRAEAKLHRFFHHWLELERAEYVDKDDTLFPEFDEQLLTDLRTSLDLFLHEAVFSEQSDYRELLLADYLYLNARLAKIYGIERDDLERDAFIKVKVPRDRRSGVITHPYLLSTLAYHNSTSPIHRGVFLTRNIIGRPLNPPPQAIEFSDANFDPTLTMREKVTAFTRNQACMSCHATINPLGFSLENYDSIGRWRTSERDQPINAESEFIGDTGESLRLKGARDVAEFAVGSKLARRGFVRQLLQHTVNRNPSALGRGTLDRLDVRFEVHDYNIRELLVEIALAEALPGVTFTDSKLGDASPRGD